MNEVFNVGHVREMLMGQLGIRANTWNYHKGRMPGPDQEYAGWPFYSAAQVDVLRAYWMRQSSVKRFLKNRAAETVGA
jgi:hypothetical protein